MRIEGKYNKTGYFWLPGKENEKIPGVLSIDDSGKIELEIIGLFGDGVKYINENRNIGRVIGHIEDDGLVTLDNCLFTRISIPFGNISKSKILANRLLSGAAWEKDEAVTFNSFSFAVDCLDEWVGISGINVDRDWERRTANIRYTPPEKIGFFLNNGMKLEICFACTLPGIPHIKEAKIMQRAYFRLESEELLELNEFTTIAFKITNLMCFAMDEVVTMKNVSAISSEILDDDGDGNKYPVSIKIYYQSLPHSEVIPKRDGHEMLFNFMAIKDNYQQIFNNWINAYEYLSPAFSLYFSTKTGAQKYTDSKFLALAQGLETYHRRTSNETL
ncbi:TPA: hypothetical protein SI321_005062, partial [Escherichia coli]|nr:hypothetical protein [Escherichia coli]